MSAGACRLIRLRGERSYADSARGTRPSGLPFSPARRAVLRRQRQRDSSLWTPFLACAASGLTQTAPEGLVPLDSLSRLRGERSCADSAKGTRPSGLPFSPAGGTRAGYVRPLVLLRPAKRTAGRKGSCGKDFCTRVQFMTNACTFFCHTATHLPRFIFHSSL